MSLQSMGLPNVLAVIFTGIGFVFLARAWLDPVNVEGRREAARRRRFYRQLESGVVYWEVRSLGRGSRLVAYGSCGTLYSALDHAAAAVRGSPGNEVLRVRVWRKR